MDNIEELYRILEVAGYDVEKARTIAAIAEALATAEVYYVIALQPEDEEGDHKLNYWQADMTPEALRKLQQMAMNRLELKNSPLRVVRDPGE